VKQIITRVDEPLAEAVKRHAALAGESVNGYITRVLRDSVDGRQAWKRDAIAAGRLSSRTDPSAEYPNVSVSTAAEYASHLVSSERDER
jgi:hypothetical protein